MKSVNKKEIKILGISGSPVKDGNTENSLQKTMESISDSDVHHEAVNLSWLDIKDCVHCSFCLSRQKPGFNSPRDYLLYK
jgi:multimeric flavodoxin WrbA